jgi:hypothetical protein
VGGHALGGRWRSVRPGIMVGLGSGALRPSSSVRLADAVAVLLVCSPRREQKLCCAVLGRIPLRAGTYIQQQRTQVCRVSRLFCSKLLCSLRLFAAQVTCQIHYLAAVAACWLCVPATIDRRGFTDTTTWHAACWEGISAVLNGVASAACCCCYRFPGAASVWWGWILPCKDYSRTWHTACCIGVLRLVERGVHVQLAAAAAAARFVSLNRSALERWLG